jgi:hypothetical protein
VDRAQALDRALACFDGAAARMREVYGLRLPRHVAVWSALWRSLSPLEAEGMDWLGRSPGGIMLWLDDDGLARVPRDGLDPRLHDRFRCDPPELVTVMWGNTDGLHYGLWYDDPAELPSCIAHNYARDSAETWAGAATVIQVLRGDLDDRLAAPDYPDEPPPEGALALVEALRWFEEPDDAAFYADDTPRYADHERGEILGGMAPALPAGAGDPRATSALVERREAAYRARAPDVAGWLAEARAELARGQPAFALTLGRELHWLDADAFRAEGLELLCAAYAALGRDALAAIARVHHAHRDLPLVGVYC